MLECRTAEDVREANRAVLRKRRELFYPSKPPVISAPMPVPQIVPNLEEEIARRNTAKARVRHMTTLVCWWFNVSPDEFHADRRSPLYVLPHWVAIYVTSRMTHWSLAEIGRQFNRDHTSVIHTIKTMKKLCVTDPAVNHLIATLESYYVD